jgi:O-antigen/teichoic acid export membrane protein
VGAQGIQAAASFALQVFAARSLGAADYGAFTVLLSLLIVLSALQAGLRDGGIVLSNDDPGIAPTLATAQWLGALLAGVIGVLAAALLGILDTAGIFLFGAMVVLWVLEEAIRRALMSDMRFDKVALNDTVYAIVSVGSAIALVGSDAVEGLNAFVAAMALGALASVLFGLLFQVPSSVLKPARPDRVRLRRLGSFAMWRSWQGLVRPLSVFATRVGVGAISGDATLGRLEAGRLLVAPFAVVANGLGTFLLPYYLRQRGSDNAAWRRAVLRPSAILLVFGALGGAVLVAFAQPLSELLIGDFSAPTFVVAGWVAYTVLDGASTPLGVAAISLGHTRRVASARTVGALLGTVLALGLAVFNVWLVPWALCLGIVLGTALLTKVALAGESVLEGRQPRVEPAP